MATKKVKSPAGFHWMKSGKSFKLMKNPTGASLGANFNIQKTHKK